MNQWRRTVRDDLGAYLAFLISFVVISRHWSAHHRIFRYLSRADDRLRFLNLTWLLAIVVIPFATKLLNVEVSGTDNTHGLRFGFYALVQVVAIVAMLAMVHEMAAKQLTVAARPPNFVRRANWDLGGRIATGDLDCRRVSSVRRTSASRR